MAKIDHIGIAVNSLREAVPLYAAILGENPRGEEAVPAEKVHVVFFGEGPGRIELLEATDPDSPVARFIERVGAGVHHVCLRVGDLEASLARAREEGAEVVAPEIRRGAGGRRVAFLHPKSAGGVLVELTEVGA